MFNKHVWCLEEVNEDGDDGEETDASGRTRYEEEVRRSTARWLESVGIPSDVPVPPGTLFAMAWINGKYLGCPLAWKMEACLTFVKPPRVSICIIACRGALPKKMALVMALPF